MSAGSKLNINPAFSAPLVETRHPDSDELNRDLRRLFLEREGPEIEPVPKTPTLKHNVFESEFSLFAWPDEPVQALKHFVIGSVIRVGQTLNDYSDDQMQRLGVSNHTWFHITREAGYASVHNHPMASWSSVYCVDPGDDEGALNPDNGVLRFHDARPAASMYLDPGNMHLRRPYNHGSINYKLQAGQLIIFPSHLMHEVTPYHGRGERITVASNFWFRTG
ncbi:MAG: putative 2OG-Fe(II) oxygenase [Wenzhouxiangella sp.]